MRNIEKMIESYQEWQKTHRGGIGDFTAMDGYNLKEISHGEYWETMFNSLYVGFIAGYRRAKKDAKEAAAKRKKPTKKEVELFRLYACSIPWQEGPYPGRSGTPCGRCRTLPVSYRPQSIP